MAILRSMTSAGRAARVLARSLILLLPLGCAGCFRHTSPENLVLVTIDTLRRDHLGTYGFEKPISPNLDRLAERGVRFDDALAQAISTPPSHASILTGLNPRRHGLQLLWGQRLPQGNLTLAEILSDAGFITAAFVSATPLRSSVGLNQGFSIYDDALSADAKERNAEQTNAAVRDWLKIRPQGRLFLWVHYFDPHGQYYPPPEYRAAFGVEHARLEHLPPGRNENPVTGTPRDTEHSLQSLELMRNLYAAEVLYTDNAFGQLMQMLEEHGILEDAIVAMVSDHGECLGERRYYWGHWDVLDETTRLPLILVHPHRRWAGRTVSAPVGTIDLVPTLLAWLGVPAPDDLDGIDLTPIIEGGTAPARVIFTEQRQLLHARSVRDANWALTEYPPTGTRHLYAREQGALIEPTTGDTEAAEARLGAAMERLEAMLPSYPVEPLKVPEAIAEKLRSLGYME
jgi:arylsulfatase A-like enzyme